MVELPVTEIPRYARDDNNTQVAILSFRFARDDNNTQVATLSLAALGMTTKLCYRILKEASHQKVNYSKK